MKGAGEQETLIKAEVTENKDYNDEVLERVFREIRAFREKYKPLLDLGELATLVS